MRRTLPDPVPPSPRWIVILGGASALAAALLLPFDARIVRLLNPGAEGPWDVLLRFLDGLTSRDAPREIRNIRRVVVRCLLDHDRVAHEALTSSERLHEVGAKIDPTACSA
jgi:hypothetical protein